MRLVVLTFAALLLAPAVARAAGETSIFYYPWWGTPQKDGKYLHWNKGGHLPPDDLASTFYPSRGAYSSRDWNVLSRQMSEIAGAGVDEVISSWWGLGSPEAERLPTVMRAAWKHGLDVAVHLEPYEKWQRTRAIVEDDLEYLRGLGIGRVYVYYPFDGLIPDAEWLELSAQFPRSSSTRRRTTQRAPPRRASTAFTRTTCMPYAVAPSRAFVHGRTGRYRLCAVGRARLQREPRNPGLPRAQSPRRRDVRRHVASGDRRRPRPRHDHELQRVARGHTDRACTAARSHDLRGVRELRGGVRPHGQGSRARVPRPHGRTGRSKYRVAAAVERVLRRVISFLS